MTIYICHKCKYTSKEKGSCPECSIALEKTCPVCGEETDACTCTSYKPQTKGQGKNPHI